MFERLRSGFWPWLPVTLSNGLTTVGLMAMIFGTSPAIGEPWHRLFFGIVIVVWGLIATESFVGFWMTPAAPGRHAYLASAEGLIDLAAAFALPLGWLVTSAPGDAPLVPRCASTSSTVVSFALSWSASACPATTTSAMVEIGVSRTSAPRRTPNSRSARPNLPTGPQTCRHFDVLATSDMSMLRIQRENTRWKLALMRATRSPAVRGSGIDSGSAGSR